MKNEINMHWVLEVTNKMMRLGTKSSANIQYLGINLSIELDGYAFELSDQYCQLHLSFHHKYHLHYDNQKALTNFMAKLEEIHKKQVMDH